MPIVVSQCSRPKCDMSIIWTVSPNGAPLPLDARPAVFYHLQEVPGRKNPDAIPLTAEVMRGPSDLFAQAGVDVAAEVIQPKVYVSHWLTCKDPPEHSKGGKK